ncbi:RagB/SusD family nutrient uptake outer membrane protein [Mucilaginibacter sp. SMC90]|uniref:RagB/SusD family nutrient uptake outer membrane protein n=1 Tax=Mucilaginibacter sp. SMC90 TaxID=2929803 RepID=UPI001FB46DC7|nr:RagB/SusD family nutrient uptake outer membrane protein [Mucilaginibacter sp. SMC90]UOE46824.1 RagB/SusD family nutrient uptake outer membrane protein [Mucilaginibacter sp. SMC90]
MKILKTIKYTLPVLTLVTLASCKKFLDVQPKDSAPDNQTIFDRPSAETAVRGIYRALSADNYYGVNFVSVGYLSGDNIQWTGSQSIVQQFIDHNVKADNATVSNIWLAIYTTINRANYVIAKLPAVTDVSLTNAEKNQLLGEAYFIRALCYFDLARTWGGVQIVTTPTLSATDKNGIARSTVEQTYAQVLSDLNTAEPLLPLPTAQNPVRANKETVYALKARYYLYQKDWANAEKYATLVLGDTQNYSLLKPYSAWFANNVIGTKESVFELAYSATYTNGHRGQWQPPANNGTRQWAPNNTFVTLVNDPAIGGNRSALVAKTTAGLWYGNLYYRSPATDPAYIIRIAEEYLIRAEANAQLNKLDDARIDLNAVRDRAGLTATTAVSQTDVLLAIENERRIEFALEGHRWFDLVRTGRAAAVLGVTDATKNILPIPVDQLNVDPALTQNPGY